MRQTPTATTITQLFCPFDGDTRLSFNSRPWGRFDEGELWSCEGCGAHGETGDLEEMVLAIDENEAEEL